MRLDKFLKTARVIKRRTVAKNVAENEKILINGIVRKPSFEVKEGDIVTLYYFDKEIVFKILRVPENNVKKEEAEELIEFIQK